MSEGIEHATSVGQTGGLPGDNADPRTRRVPEDELASTVQRGDVAQSADDGERHADGSMSDDVAGADGAADDGSGAATRTAQGGTGPTVGPGDTVQPSDRAPGETTPDELDA